MSLPAIAAWAYDFATNRWTELSPAGDRPPARRFHSMVYDSGANKMILFGGYGFDGVRLNDTWASGQEP